MRRDIPPSPRPRGETGETAGRRARAPRRGRTAAPAGLVEQSAGADAVQLRLALAQLPARLLKAVRSFRVHTGFTAVTSLRCLVDDHDGAGVKGGDGVGLVPPVHPLCASMLRGNPSEAPCEAQWRMHVQTGIRTHSIQRHTCPLGLRCSCVPIHFGGTLVGVAKFVAGPDTPLGRFSSAVEMLELTVGGTCQGLQVTALSSELQTLRRRIAQFQAIRDGAKTRAAPVDRNTESADPPEGLAGVHGGSLVDRALAFIGRHYLDPGFSLQGISLALGVNGKYLTSLFTSIVGQHMHAYVQQVRLQRACHLLLATEYPIKQIGYESGFKAPEVFRRAFRRQMGVSARTYRRVFSVT